MRDAKSKHGRLVGCYSVALAPSIARTTPLQSNAGIVEAPGSPAGPIFAVALSPPPPAASHRGCDPGWPAPPRARGPSAPSTASTIAARSPACRCCRAACSSACRCAAAMPSVSLAVKSAKRAFRMVSPFRASCAVQDSVAAPSLTSWDCVPWLPQQARNEYVLQTNSKTQCR